MKRRILQIMPADGWRARFEEKADKLEWNDPLVCWALVNDEEDGYRFVVGMIACEGEILFCDVFSSQFQGYEGPNANASDEAGDA